MSELSFMGKLMQAMELSKAAHVGMELTYFDVIELLGEIESLKGYIAELEADKRRAEQMIERLIEVGRMIGSSVELLVITETDIETWDALVAEWRARNE